MANKLSDCLSDELIKELKLKIKKAEFGDLDFKMALKFILSDGVLPRSGADLKSFLELESWIKKAVVKTHRFTATQLKNQTGQVIDKALSGNEVFIFKHGRPILKIVATNPDFQDFK